MAVGAFRVWCRCGAGSAGEGFVCVGVCAGVCPGG